MNRQCITCNNRILNHDFSLECTVCKKSFHLKCLFPISRNDLVNLDINHWICVNCLSDNLPFLNISDDNDFEDSINDLNNDIQGLHNLNNVFNPFDLNDDDLLYIDDADPDNFFNDLSCLSNIKNCKYYNVVSFKDKCNDINLVNNMLSLIHVNIRSVRKNFSHFDNYLKCLSFSPSIIALSETWLKKGESNLYTLPNYNTESLCRSQKSGGGVSIMIKSSLSYRLRSDLSMINNFSESLFVEIPKNNNNYHKDILIGVIYRPPNENMDIFNDYVTNLLDSLQTENKVIYLCGDFNINLLNSSTHTETDNFLNCLYSHSIFPLISKPTRKARNSATLIDNIFTNDIANSEIVSGILYTDISDHFPIFCINKGNSVSEAKNYINKRYYSHESTLNFIGDLENINWENVCSTNEAQLAFTMFYEKLCSLYNKHFPIKRVKIGYKTRKPWLSANIINCIKNKNRLYIYSLKHPTDDNILKYKNYKRTLNKAMNNLERKHYQDLLINNKKNLRKSWEIIKSVINNNKKSKKTNEHFKINNTVTNDEKIIANSFNKFFVNIGSNLARKIPTVDGNILDCITRNPHSIFLKEIEVNEIKNIISTMKENSPGDDGITPKILKKTSHLYLEPLQHILQLSLSQGIFPKELKLAKIVPLYKNGDEMELNNYRPISILPAFSKILERLMYNRCINFFDNFGVLHNLQFGFRQKHGTNLAMIHLIDKIASEINDNNVVMGLFIDLKKAFDTVDHKILLKKLEYLGIRGIALNWFYSYLEERKQFVQFNNTKSNQLSVKCGVPQGSILGPLLFILYINDLPMVSNLFTSLLFADDTSIFMAGKNINDVILLMNSELKKLVKWLYINKLSLSIEKTNYMVFRSPRKKISRFCEITIDSIVIRELEKIKFLGVILDNKLIWNEHIQNVKNKICKSIGILCKCKKYFNENTLIALYYSFVYPHLCYCIEVWGNASQVHMLVLINLQKKILRIIASKRYREHCAPLFSKFKIFDIEQIYKFFVILFVYKYQRKLLPNLFNNFFTHLSNVHDHNTRNNEGFFVPYSRTECYKKLIRFTGVNFWNKIHTKINRNCTYQTYKKNLKRIILNVR